MRLFWAVLIFSVCVDISRQLIGLVNQLIDENISTQMSISVQAATMARVLSLPADVFKRFSAGELTTKVQYFNSFCTTLYSGFVAVGLSSLFSLVYISQIFRYTPALLVPSLSVTVATLGYSVFSTYLRMKFSSKAMEAAGKKNGLTYALLAGIQKIRLSGAEGRAFTRWTKVYTEEVKNTYGIPKSTLLSGTVGIAIALAGNLAIYYFALQAHISVADYYAFTSAYGMVSGAFSALLGIGLQVANIRPTLEQVAPIMEAEPEVSEDRNMVNRLSG
jgi:ABC-type bacteriocin/lantibiotic exporter with double-glycine peptidase domain